jgi:hypothetical protein
VLNNFEFAKSVHTGRSHTELREVDLALEARLTSDHLVKDAHPDELGAAAFLGKVDRANMVGYGRLVELGELLAHELVRWPVDALTLGGAVGDAAAGRALADAGFVAQGA